MRVADPILVVTIFSLVSTVQASEGAHDAVAIIDGHAISAQYLEERAAPHLRELYSDVYDIKEQILNDLIEEQILKEEAIRRKVSVPQLLDAEVYGKLVPATPSEVESYYLGIKDRTNRPLETVRDQIAEFLLQSRRQAAYSTYLAVLKQHSRIAILLSPPRTPVAIDSKRVRGPLDAPITIVEFSDYECPYCARAESTVRELFSKYPTQIKLGYRDFPIDSLHQHARPAAEASRCALAQGKFWEFHDFLFAHQEQLETKDFDDIASQLGIDSAKFHICVDARTFSADVQHDLDEGQTIGITGTPGFFVNGIGPKGAVSLEEFEKIIDRELAHAKAKTH